MIKKNANKNSFDKLTKLIFQFLTLLFLVCLMFRITTHIKFVGRGWTTYFPYILFVIVFTFKRKPTWFIGFIYSTYGLYYYLFVIKEYPSYIEFTLPIVELFYGDGGGFSTASPTVHYLLLFPFIFYLIYSLSYLITSAVKLTQYFSKRIDSNRLNNLIDQELNEK